MDYTQDTPDAVLTLEELTALAGEQQMSLDSGKKFTSPFEPNVAYLVECTEQQHTVSKNGFNQLELSLSIVESTGGTRKAGRIWECLPVFSDEVAARLADEPGLSEGDTKLEQLTSMFGRNIHGLLRAVNPDFWSVYARREKEGGRTVFYDADGHPMSKLERDEKKAALGKAVLGAAQAVLQGKLSFVGKRWYLVEKATPAGKLYKNYFDQPPEKFPLAE